MSKSNSNLFSEANGFPHDFHVTITGEVYHHLRKLPDPIVVVKVTTCLESRTSQYYIEAGTLRGTWTDIWE